MKMFRGKSRGVVIDAILLTILIIIGGLGIGAIVTPAVARMHSTR